MLEKYFVKPQTVDRIRASWIGPEVESYVAWMAEHGYKARNVLSRVPVLLAFAEFARVRGAETSRSTSRPSLPIVSPGMPARGGTGRCVPCWPKRFAARSSRC
jgi:hypothetical protein